MKVAFVGNFEEQKGSKLFIELVRTLKDEHEWFILGNIKDPQLISPIKRYIAHYGAYQYGDLGLEFRKHKIDLVLLLSLFPETFSLTFFECIEENIPFIATPVGFPKSVFPNYPWFLDNITNESLVQSINHASSRKGREQIRRFIINFKKKNWDEFIQKSRLKYKYIKNYL